MSRWLMHYAVVLVLSLVAPVPAAQAFNAPTLDGGSTIVVSGRLPATLSTLFGDMGRAALWGIKGDGATDDSAAINAMLSATPNAQLPPFNFRITKPLVVPTSSKVYGFGRTKSVLLVGADFSPMGAPGVIQCGSAEPACEISDIGVSFAQPSQSVRANLIQYPPAIYAPWPRSRIERVRVSNAISCFDMRGNSGGAWLLNSECGAFGKGLQIDGAQDFVHVHGYHFWPFGASADANLMLIFTDGMTEAAEIGRADGFDGSGWSTFLGSIKWTANAAQSAGTNVIDGLQLDGDGANLVSLGGRQKIVGGYSSKTSALIGTPFQVAGGAVSLHGFDFYGSTPSTPIQVTSGNLTWVGGRINCNNGTVSCGTVTGGVLILDGVELAPGGAWSAPYFAQSAGGNLRAAVGYVVTPVASATPSGGTAPTIFSFATDQALNLYTRSFTANGWGISAPASVALGYYGPYSSVVTNPAPAAAWSIDGSKVPFALASGQTLTLPSGSGLVLVSAGNADTAIFLVSGGTVSLLPGAVGSTFVSGVPTSGKIGLSFIGGAYTFTSNYGSSLNLTIIDFRTRASP